jgi:hypothetical protein
LPRNSGRTRTACYPTGTGASAASGAALAIGVDAGAGAGAADAARVIWAERGVATGGTVRIRGAAASVAVAAAVAAFVGAVVLCAAYCAADDATDDKDDDDDDRCDPPFRAIPRRLRDGGPGTVLQVSFFVREGEGAGAVAICEWLLVRRLAFWSWRRGRAAIAAFV